MWRCHLVPGYVAGFVAEVICFLAAHLLKCQSSLCLHAGSRLLLSCFYIASLWLQQFLWVSRRRVILAPSFLCEWSQRLWRSRQIKLLPLGFFTYTFKNSTDSQNLWRRWFISLKSMLFLPNYLLNFGFYAFA